jgi:hypothetical protein
LCFVSLRKSWTAAEGRGDELRCPADPSHLSRLAGAYSRPLTRFRCYLLHAHRRARRLTRAGLDVGEALVKRLGENGRLDPSYACLATDADCDKRTVGRALADTRDLGLLRWTRRLVRNGPYVEQTSNAYELTPASAAATLPSGSTRIGDGQKGRQTDFVDITYCPPSNKLQEAQAALARVRARMEQRLLGNGCRMVPAT